jgi:hypothetical protein
MHEEETYTPAQEALLAELEASGNGSQAVFAYYAQVDREAEHEAAQPSASAAQEAPDESTAAGAALAALAAERERAELVAGARALIAQSPEAYAVTAEMADALEPSELLQLTGIEPAPAAESRTDDRPANAEAAHKHSVEMLDRRWWTLTDGERRAQVDALGLDWEVCVEAKQRELERW